MSKTSRKTPLERDRGLHADIFDSVSETFGISKSIIYGSPRYNHPTIHMARLVAIYLLRSRLHYTSTDIASLFDMDISNVGRILRRLDREPQSVELMGVFLKEVALKLNHKWKGKTI